MPLPAIQTKLKSGKEGFTLGNGDCAKLQDFWQWSFSNLMDNSLRGALAEFIVRLALEIKDEVRNNWTAYDLKTQSGLKIEVKASAYLQWWHQKEESKIIFDIASAAGWDPKTNVIDADTKRQADVYVFCLLKEKVKELVNPLNLNQWDFYVVETATLNQKHPTAKSLGLRALEKLCPKSFSFGELKAIIQTIDCKVRQ
jgi:hypothetical protein